MITGRSRGGRIISSVLGSDRARLNQSIAAAERRRKKIFANGEKARAYLLELGVPDAGDSLLGLYLAMIAAGCTPAKALAAEALDRYKNLIFDGEHDASEKIVFSLEGK